MWEVISTILARSQSSVKAEIAIPKAGSSSFRSQTKRQPAVSLQLSWSSPHLLTPSRPFVSFRAFSATGSFLFWFPFLERL